MQSIHEESGTTVRAVKTTVNLTWRVYLEVWCAVIRTLHTLFPKKLFQGNKVRFADLVLENFQPDWKSRSVTDEKSYINGAIGGRLPAFAHGLAF